MSLEIDIAIELAVELDVELDADKDIERNIYYPTLPLALGPPLPCWTMTLACAPEGVSGARHAWGARSQARSHFKSLLENRSNLICLHTVVLVSCEKHKLKARHNPGHSSMTHAPLSPRRPSRFTAPQSSVILFKTMCASQSHGRLVYICLLCTQVRGGQ